MKSFETFFLFLIRQIWGFFWSDCREFFFGVTIPVLGYQSNLCHLDEKEKKIFYLLKML